MACITTDPNHIAYAKIDFLVAGDEIDWLPDEIEPTIFHHLTITI
jgi:hypothetical protein